MDRFKKVQRTAWTILLLAFLACLVLAIGTPLTTRWFVLNSTRPLVVVVQPRSGIVSQRQSGSATSVLVNEGTEIRHDNTLTLSENGRALLLFYHPDVKDTEEMGTPIATVQLYGKTEITIEAAQTPRFASSPLPHRVKLRIQRGANTHISVESNERPTVLYIQTPHGSIEMDQGTYTVAVEQDQTEFSVGNGRAYLTDPTSEDRPVLTAPQRVELTANGIGEIFIGERDILRTRNGDFEEDFEGSWEVYTRTGDPAESGGLVRQTTVQDGHRIVLLTRVGQQFAETGITQEINQDIHGAKSLQVRARVRVDVQTLGTCGSQGSECPIMLRIKYTDQSGAVREWLQGFYAIEGDDAPFCPSCEWQAEQIKVAGPGIWYNYESPDLLPSLKALDIEPATIHRVDIYASGHTYGAAIDEIAILVGE